MYESRIHGSRIMERERARSRAEDIGRHEEDDIMKYTREQAIEIASRAIAIEQEAIDHMRASEAHIIRTAGMTMDERIADRKIHPANDMDMALRASKRASNAHIEASIAYDAIGDTAKASKHRKASAKHENGRWNFTTLTK